MNIEVGSIVTLDGYSGFCDRQKAKIKEIKTRYDQNDGTKYSVYVVMDGQEFDGRNGFAITCPTAYFIEELLKTK